MMTNFLARAFGRLVPKSYLLPHGAIPASYDAQWFQKGMNPPLPGTSSVAEAAS